MASLSMHNGAVSWLATRIYIESSQALHSSMIETLAFRLEMCGSLLSRMSLRSGRGGSKTSLQKFTDNCIDKLRKPFEILSGVCSAHGVENPFRMLLIMNVAENFAVVFEGAPCSYKCLLQQSQDPRVHEHAYVPIMSPFLGDHDNFRRGEEIQNVVDFLPRQAKVIMDAAASIYQGF